MSASERDTASPPVPAWRIALGIFVLAALAWQGVALIPVYWHNLQLQKSLRAFPVIAEDAVKKRVIEEGRSLGLEIVPDNVQVKRSADNGQTAVRYVVRVNLSVYTVDLHFSSMVGNTGGRPQQ